MEASEQNQKYLFELNAISTEILASYPFKMCAKKLKDKNIYASYSHYSSDLQEIFDAIQSKFDNRALVLFKKLLMIYFIQNPHERLGYVRLSEELKSLQQEEFKRILLEMTTLPDSFYLERTDLFNKDFSLCTEKLVFAKAQLLEFFIKKSPRMFLSNNFFLFLKNIFWFVKKFKGKSHYIEIHTSDKHLSFFNEGGWLETYRYIDQLLLENKNIRGFIGASWFYDPKLSFISPRLNYLRKFPQENGAYFIAQFSDNDTIDLATRTSSTRKELFQQGKYIPFKYMMVWERNDILTAFRSLHEKKN